MAFDMGETATAQPPMIGYPTQQTKNISSSSTSVSLSHKRSEPITRTLENSLISSTTPPFPNNGLTKSTLNQVPSDRAQGNFPPEYYTCDPEQKALIDKALSTFTYIDESIYVGSAKNIGKEEYMPCNCKITRDDNGSKKACGEYSDCINRLLLVECSRGVCPGGKYCQNQRFQRRQNAPVRLVEFFDKGFGLQAVEEFSEGRFVMEYVGEVISYNGFLRRTERYNEQGNRHFYFMSLKSDKFIDATCYGSLARFINHSCNPNCILQKWMVGSRLCIGIFTRRSIKEGEELTFDYKFETYGAVAQPCYCGEANCKGTLGSGKHTELRGLESLADELSSNKPLRGVIDEDQCSKLVQLMLQLSQQPEQAILLLEKLKLTDEPRLLRHFVRLHGIVTLKTWLVEYQTDDNICDTILYILEKLPLTYKNKLLDANIYDAMREHAALKPEGDERDRIETLIARWEELPKKYIIPRLPPSASRTNSDSPENTNSTRSPKSSDNLRCTYPPKPERRHSGYLGRTNNSNFGHSSYRSTYSRSLGFRNNHPLSRSSPSTTQNNPLLRPLPDVSHIGDNSSTPILSSLNSAPPPQGHHHQQHSQSLSSEFPSPRYGANQIPYFASSNPPDLHHHHAPQHYQQQRPPGSFPDNNFKNSQEMQSNSWAPGLPNMNALHVPDQASAYPSPGQQHSNNGFMPAQNGVPTLPSQSTTPDQTQTNSMPPDWLSAIAPSGQTYYYNRITKATTWTKPSVPTTTPDLEKQPRDLNGLTGSSLPNSAFQIPTVMVEVRKLPPARVISSSPKRSHDFSMPSPKRKGSSTDKAYPRDELVARCRKMFSLQVVEFFSKYSRKLSKEIFKKHAERMTSSLVDKEMRAPCYKEGRMRKMTSEVRDRIKEFVIHYAERLLEKKMEYELSQAKD